MLLVVVTMMGLLDGAVSLPEGATCNFSWDFDSFLGKRLTNQVIETKEGISLLQCVRECLDMDSTVCRSVNYNRQQRKCQLNSMDERLVPWDMSSSAGWNYYHKRISSPDVSLAPMHQLFVKEHYQEKETTIIKFLVSSE